MNYERLSRDSAEASVQISSRAEPQPKLESTHKTHGNHNPQFLYPTQQVAESTMFFTRPSVSQSVSQSYRQSCFSCQRNSSETTQQNFLKLCSYEGHNM